MAFTIVLAERSFDGDDAAPSHTISSGPTSGNLLYATVTSRSAGTGSGNAITVSGWTTIQQGSGGTLAHQVWVGYKVSDGTETVVTPTLPGGGGGTDTCISYMEVSGFSGTPTLDVSNEDESNIDGPPVTAQPTGSATATQAVGIAIAAVSAFLSNAWFTTTSWSNSFVEQSDGGNNATLPGAWVATLEYASTGAKTTTQTTTDTGDEAYGAIALFYDAGAGDTVTLTDIEDDKIFQRVKATNNKSITISGTYSGTPTAIAARIVDDGTSDEVVTWTTIDASPSAGTFSGALTVPEGGWYNVQVRYTNDTGVVSNGTNGWGIGVLIGCIGQSNMENWFTDGSAQSPNAVLRKYQASAWAVLGAASNGATAFGNRIIANMAASVPVGLVDSSVGGSALRSEADSGNGYWLNTAGSSVYDDFDVAVTALGGELEFVVWAQGERDARSGLVTEAEYEGSTGGLEDFITNQVRTDITNASDQTSLPFIISLLGRGTDGGDTDANFQAIRNAQQNVANSLADCYRVTTVDLPLVDGIHYTPAGYTTHGERCAQVVLDILGDETYSRGPQTVNWSEVSATQTDITMVHDGGTDFTPTSAITGFQVLDGGTPTTISAAVRQDATTVRLTHTSVAGVRTARYLYGANPTITGVVVDNTALTLPLEGSDSIVAAPVAITGTSNTTDQDDTSVATGTLTAIGTSNTTDQDDTSVATGTLTAIGTSNTTDQDDTSVATGTVGVVTVITGTSNTTDQDDTSHASGIVGVYEFGKIIKLTRYKRTFKVVS